MELSPRDLALVQLVARFSQLAAPHLGEVIFGERSCTPLDRALARLVRHDYLRRVGRRSTDDRPGSGGYVYELGKAGWAAAGKPQRYRRKYGISNHTLKVADVYVELL
ncbi:MAG: replication-relaxation family protein, partial [Pseudonocardiales bacterium]